VVFWNLTFANDYVSSSLASAIDTIDLPWAAAESTLARAGPRSDTQALVSWAGRAVVVAIALLAGVGALRMLRSGWPLRGATALAVAPFALFASGSYGGELLFRIYLFALPFLAFLAAHAFAGPAAGRRPALAGPALGLTTAVLLGCSVIAYYGKDRQFYFSPGEIAASRFVYEHARPGTLLIEGTRSYPGQFRNYERLDYVTLSREPPASQARVVAAPVATLSEWMTDPSRRGAYLIITRAQKAEVAELGVMPRGSLDRIERALSRSRRFRTVVRNRDAVVFAPARPRAGS